MISDNIRGTAAVAALASLAMLASAGVASAAAIGTPTIIDRDTTFVNDETVDLLGGDLGEAANFGLVGFDSIRLNAHTNGNIATAHAYVGAAFGNHAAGVDEPEVSYLGKVDGSINVSLPADSKIAFGQSNTIGQTDNGDSWTVNGNKLEMQTGGSLPKSKRVLRDSKVKYLDLKAMERSMTALSAKWAKTAPANASYDFSDMNRRHITADGDEAHLDIDAAELQGNRVTATLGEKTRLIVNVDAEGADDITLPQLDVDGINHAEYAHWTDKGVIYNLTDSKSEDGQYHGRVGTAGATSSVILAPEADVDASQNVEGQIIARNVVIGGDGQYEDSDLPADVTDMVPTRDGYEFDGWTIDGDNVESGDGVEDNGSDVTVVAQWTPVRQDVTPTKPDTPKNDTDKPSGKTDNGSDDSGKTDTDKPSKDDSGKTDTDKPSGTDTPSKDDGKDDNGSDDSGKTDTDKPSDANTSKGQSDATSKAESPKDGLASTGVAVAVVAVAVVVLAAGAIALAILGKRK